MKKDSSSTTSTYIIRNVFTNAFLCKMHPDTGEAYFDKQTLPDDECIFLSKSEARRILFQINKRNWCGTKQRLQIVRLQDYMDLFEDDLSEEA